MKVLLVLKKIHIENANAVAGFTYGFPAITNFLGFTHALSRKLTVTHPKLKLEGCAVISHWQQIHKYSSRRGHDAVFCLTRNPLTEKGTSPPFIEEGRMHLTLSLLIECDYAGFMGEEDRIECSEKIRQLALTQRLAGGLVTKIEKISFENFPEDHEERSGFARKHMLRVLPGFLLVERSHLLIEHKQKEQIAAPLDAWLDFVALKSKAQLKQGEGDSETVEYSWPHLPKPASGWLVPLMAGYRAISELHKAGSVANARDRNTPFRFVESVYTIGEWLSPHRVKDLSQIFWRYEAQPESGWYLCKNHYPE